MARFFKLTYCVVIAAAALAAIALPARAETCQTPDNLTFVTGSGHCLAIKTYLPEGGGKGVLAVVLHGDLSSGGTADYIFDLAKEAAKAGAVGVAMMRPGYEGDGRRSSGMMTRDQSNDDKYKADQIDSMTAAVRALKAHHGANRVVMIGHSGGAVASGVMAGRAAPLVDAAILVSCPCDVATWRRDDGRNPYNNAESPHAYVAKLPKTTRVVTVTGENDGNTPPRLARAYVEAATAAGISAQALVVPGAGHGMNRLKEDPQLYAAIRQAVAGY